MRLELNNDLFFADDSQFSNGFSLQYHGLCYDTWGESRAPAWVKWVGEHFPTLNDGDTVVRYGQGVGQNLVTPADIQAEVPLEGDIPYAATLTYSLGWQSFNDAKASVFQATVGVMGEEALGKQVQKFVHNDLGAGDDPKGWATQRDSEPILNLSYEHLRSLVRFGETDGGWAGRLEAGPAVHVGNLLTAVEAGGLFRWGWNIPKGFAAAPAPPGRGLFKAINLPKPESVSPHAWEVVLGARASGMLYSVLYDGSFITDDDRDVERKACIFSGGIGFNYYHYDRFTVRLLFLMNSDVIDEDSIPDPGPGIEKTDPATSYGSIMLEFPF